MKVNTVASLILAGILLLTTSTPASASLIKIMPNGNLALNVLGLSVEKPASLEIKELALGDESDAVVAFSKNAEGKISLTITSDNANSQFDVTNYQEEIVEIEERKEASRVSISQEGGEFVLRQKDVAAKTTYPLSINPKSAEITVSTPSGARYLAVLPYAAYETAVKAQAISGLEKDGRMEIKEGEDGVLAYIIPGEKTLDLFNIIEYKVPIKASISASTGEVVLIDAPSWYRILGFLFV